MKASLLVKVTVLFTDKKPVMNAEVRGDTREFTDEDGNAEVRISSEVTKKSPLVGGNVEVLYEGQKRVQFLEGERNRTRKFKVDDIDLPPPPAKTYTLTIKSEPEGVGGGATPYNVGTHVDIPELTKIDLHPTVLKPGYEYSGWDWNGEMMAAKDLKFDIVADAEITFHYKQVRVFHMLTTHLIGEGTIMPPPGKGDFPDGHVIEIFANHAPGYYLHHFELDGAVSEYPPKLVMDRKHDLHIVFRQKHP